MYAMVFMDGMGDSLLLHPGPDGTTVGQPTWTVRIPTYKPRKLGTGGGRGSLSRSTMSLANDVQGYMWTQVERVKEKQDPQKKHPGRGTGGS